MPAGNNRPWSFSNPRKQTKFQKGTIQKLQLIRLNFWGTLYVKVQKELNCDMNAHP